MIRGKRILLGVTGSIAAYKAATLVRLLVKEGARVQVIMTADATSFITPLTLSTLSKNPVYTHYFDKETGEWTNHVELGLWADLVVIAPATANTIAKMASGICDNLLQAVWLSAKCPVVIAPAMDLDMYRHPTFNRNLDLLREFGVKVADAESGELASGLTGQGRMAEPENLVQFIRDQFPARLTGKKVLINGGPTYEAIDPVRFIGNRSSGKMGVALANAFARENAEVTLVLGPSHEIPDHSVNTIRVESAEEMYRATEMHFAGSDITILAAAVSDYRPVDPVKNKIKKAGKTLVIELEKTTDILETLGRKKKKKQVLAGFALETDNELTNAIEKLNKKNLDFIVLNSLRDEGAGFGVDTNKITILDKKGKSHTFGLRDKLSVAKDIVEFTIGLI